VNNKSVYIIGGGNSLKGFDFEKLRNEDTISVNKSASYVPNLDYFITMDFTALKKIQDLKKCKATKIFIANFTEPYIEEKDGKIQDTRFGLIYKLEDFDVVIKSRDKEYFGLTFNDFRHGCNSGYCALQLAIILGYKEINLLGIDLIAGEGTHFFEGYGEGIKSFNKKLDIYYSYFTQGILAFYDKHLNVNIYNCSKNSRLDEILEYKEI